MDSVCDKKTYLNFPSCVKGHLPIIAQNIFFSVILNGVCRMFKRISVKDLDSSILLGWLHAARHQFNLQVKLWLKEGTSARTATTPWVTILVKPNFNMSIIFSSSLFSGSVAGVLLASRHRSVLMKMDLRFGLGHQAELCCSCLIHQRVS